MGTYAGTNYGNAPISLAVIDSRNREASMTPLIRLEDVVKGLGYRNLTYENRAAPIQNPKSVQEYGKAMSIGGPDYPKIIEERAKGLQEVPGEQVSAARYSMIIPLAEEKRDKILKSTGTIDDKLRDDKKSGLKGKMYQQYVFAYDGKLYVMPGQVRREATEYFERMRKASSKIRPDLSEKMKQEAYSVSVTDLGSEFEITHVGNLTGIKYLVVLPKIGYKGILPIMPTQLDKAA